MVKLPNQVKNMIEDYVKDEGYSCEEGKMEGLDFKLTAKEKGDNPTYVIVIRKAKGQDKTIISTGWNFEGDTTKLVKEKSFQYDLRKGWLHLGLEYSFKDIKEKYYITCFDSIRDSDLDATSFHEVLKKIRFGKTLFALEASRIQVTPTTSTEEPSAGDVGVF